MRSLSSKKDTKRSLKKIEEKAEGANKESNQIKAKPPKQKKNSSTIKSERTEAEAKEADGESSEFVAKNDVETARETDEEHPGHRTANEEAGSIVLHVGHDMDERKKTAISNEENCSEGEATMEYRREETNGKQTENVIETDCPGEELLEHRMRTDEEAGSIVLHVGHDMNEKEKNDEESDEGSSSKRGT